MRQIASGSRITSAAARSQLSSAARDHSISAVRSGNSGTGIPGRIDSRVRITSAVPYSTWSESTWPASWANTPRSCSTSNSLTSSELTTTSGRAEPIVAALASGCWVMYSSGTGSMSSVMKARSWARWTSGSWLSPRRTAEPRMPRRRARS